MVLLGKIMILQGVGHPISCLGVCYANDPKKGGYMTPAPALDLTTSLRGDFLSVSFNDKTLGRYHECPNWVNPGIPWKWYTRTNYGQMQDLMHTHRFPLPSSVACSLAPSLPPSLSLPLPLSLSLSLALSVSLSLSPPLPPPPPPLLSPSLHLIHTKSKIVIP